MTDRKRSQVVIHLGHGVQGAERRKALEKAASLLNETLSAWSRSVLCAAAGMPGEQLVTRAEVTELERRLEALEKRAPPQTVMVNGVLSTRSPDCCGCLFPHALCGPCMRWNGRGTGG